MNPSSIPTARTTLNLELRNQSTAFSCHAEERAFCATKDRNAKTRQNVKTKEETYCVFFGCPGPGPNGIPTAGVLGFAASGNFPAVSITCIAR
jgi:hypothetical protein